MKTKLYIVFILIMFACLPFEAQAVEHNFAAGSIIIPMDRFYQPEDAVPGSGLQDGGILEAYGLVYYLLDHQDQAALADCALLSEPAREVCEIKSPHDITVYWVIDQEKTEITGADLIIQDDTLPRTEGAETISEVVRLFNHAGGDPTVFTFDVANGDSANKITYRGGIWVIDINDLTRDNDPDLDDLVALEDIIRDSNWSQVKVHVAQVPFAASVFRRMQGKPPRIALMNSEEDTTKGNADILESYLRLAGICPDNYDVLSPNSIGGVVDVGGDGSAVKHTESALIAGGYDFLWAPHWTGIDSYDGDVNMDGVDDVEEIISGVQQYLKGGGALLAECAAIETFEYSENGRFLSDHGFAHNGGTNDAADIIYNDVTAPYSQIGDFDGLFDPEGGHLHNWRPYQIGDEGQNFNFDEPPSSNATYNDTITRFTIDNTGWDYYVGGYAYGQSNYGYVVYLGGHKYAKCADEKGLAQSNAHTMKFEFEKNLTNEILKLKVSYTLSGESQETMAMPDIYMTAPSWAGYKAGTELEIDFTNATIKGKKIEGAVFSNLTDKDLTVDYIELDWSDGDSSQKIKKIEDLFTDIKHLNQQQTNRTLELTISPTGNFTIEKSPGVASGSGCAQNDKCEWTNIAAVRYVLNTLFNIEYDLANVEYVRAAPIVSHPYLYQGSFEYPGYFGHFRRYDVTQTVPASGNPVADWDTGDEISPLVPTPQTGNADGRKVYTVQDAASENFTKINFDFASINALRTRLDLTPDIGAGEDQDEEYLINRLRGKYWDFNADVPAYLDYVNRLGAIMHSAPVIVRGGDKDSRFSGRPEVAYVGDLSGMLHAIKTSTGEELWAYIPSNLLGKLQNVRTDPNAVEDFAAVDGSPTAKDIYYDPDFDAATMNPADEDKQWHTILVCPQGFGGKSVFVLDITNPDPGAWKVLWEVTVADPDPDTPGGAMGHSFRTSLDKIKEPVRDGNGDPVPGEYVTKWRVFVATSFTDIVQDKGGINVFAFDLKTGDKKWAFSSEYADSVNDIPGAVTTYDIDGDTHADRIYVGDMNGRLWELDAHDPDPADTDDDNRSIHKKGNGDPIPLFSAGVGNPISVSPAITRRNGHVILIFGTGGADWAANDKAYKIYAVDATAAGNLAQSDINSNLASTGGAHTESWFLALDVGQKVWSSPTISAGQVWIATASGSMESADPNNDTQGEGKLQVLDLDSGIALWENPLSIGKVRGSLFVTRQHVYATTVAGDIIQLGNEDFSAGTGNRVVVRSWRHQ